MLARKKRRKKKYMRAHEWRHGSIKGIFGWIICDSWNLTSSVAVEGPERVKIFTHAGARMNATVLVKNCDTWNYEIKWKLMTRLRRRPYVIPSRLRFKFILFLSEIISHISELKPIGLFLFGEKEKGLMLLCHVTRLSGGSQFAKATQQDKDGGECEENVSERTW